MPHFVSNERHLSALMKDEIWNWRRGNEKRSGTPVIAQIGSGEGGHHSPPLTGG
jgi:hypothetical protein